MIEYSFTSDALVAAGVGLAAQQITSPILEVSTLKAIGTHLAGNVLLVFFMNKQKVASAFTHILAINVSFLSSLIFFTIVHRLFFHPLRKFPGKKLAAVSKIYEASVNWNGQLSPSIRELHRKHGDFIRIGPNDIAINNVEAIETIFARSAPSGRGPFYEFAKTMGGYNLITMRKRDVHSTWRRIWLVFHATSTMDN
jgi:hypothetical protein